MPQYLYEALDKGGRQIKGTIEAASEEVIVEKLKGMGYYLLKLGIHKTKTSGHDLSSLPVIRNLCHRIKTKDVMAFTRQLATLLDAGLPVLRSLNILTEQTESVIFRKKITQIAKDIEGGASMSEAFGKHPRVFDKLYVNMLRAGEIGGVLETVLNKIAEFLEKRQAIKGKVRSALMYPVVVMSLATIIVAVIMIKVIPRFQEIFTGLGAELPKLTKILIETSHILIYRTHYVVIAAAFLIFFYRKLNGTKQGKYLIDNCKLNAPLFGQLFRKSAIMRFSSTLSTLIHSGVPILQALDIVRDSSGNEVISESVKKVYNSVKDGETIHEPLSECSIFPPMVVHMIAVGEETGAIDQMLNKVAESYEREVDDMVNGLTSILEPLLIVFLGVVVGVIVVALYLPLFMIPGIINGGDQIVK